MPQVYVENPVMEIQYLDSDDEFDTDLSEHFNALCSVTEAKITKVKNTELFGRRKSIKSKIVSLFRSNKDILSDVAGVDYNEFYTEKGVFLEKLGPEFVDTLVVVCPVNSEEFDENGDSKDLCSEYNKRICCLFDKYKLRGVFAKTIGSSRYADYSLIPQSVYTEYKKTRPATDKWQDGYLKFKLDTGKFGLDEIFDVIENEDMWHVAAKDFIFHKELDVTQDYVGSMDRTTIERHLLKLGLMKGVSAAVAQKLGAIGLILENSSDVGDNCITWLEFHENFVLRKKLYLKIVQMLEMASVRSEIGSNVPNLVANKEEEFQKKLVQAKDRGLTRLECTFYTNKVYKKQVYKDELQNMLGLVNKPFFYTTPFESSWKSLAKRIISSMFIYVPETGELAYCQWINSLTGKIQGMYVKGVDEDAMKWIRDAYSFNDRPIYFLRLDIQDTKCIFVDQEIYFRDEDSITLIPGVRKSMYPSKRTTVEHFKGFDCMGLTKQSNVQLDWPDKRLSPNNGSVAKTSFRGEFEFAVRNGRVVEREAKNKATQEFVKQLQVDIHEKRRLAKETYDKLLQPLSDSKYLYFKLLKECVLIRSDLLDIDVPYHMYGYYRNGIGHHYMMYNPKDYKFYTCVLSNPNLEAEVETFIKLVPQNKNITLYTCGKPFLYITPTHIKTDANKHRKAVVNIVRTETDDEIRRNLREFFTANLVSREHKQLQIISHIKTANYKQDAAVLQKDETYLVMAYGIKEFRNVERFFVIVKNVASNAELKIKAGRNLEALIREKAAISTTQFQVKMLGKDNHSDGNKDIGFQSDL